MTEAYKFKPKKRLGQHFLKDPKIIQKIIEGTGFSEFDHVLEIGSGLGALTIPLAKHVNKITAVEKDHQLVDMLQKKISEAGITNVRLIHADILTLDWGRLKGGPAEKMEIVGNLPYSISSPLMDRLFRYRDFIDRAVLMFQYEFAKRLLSPPNKKDYGAITVLLRYQASVSPVLEISREAFYPKPKVGSMVLSIDMDKPHPRRAENEAVFKNVVKAAFAHRRKTILNSLKRALTSRDVVEISGALESCSIDPMRRAETLEIDDFLCLAAALD